MAPDYKKWTPVADVYDPILVGSIDGTDAEPHDRGIVRALCSTYRPNKGVKGDPERTMFVSRLNHNTNEETIRSIFSKYGQLESIRLIRDIITGFSKGYAFVQFYDRHASYKAIRDANKMVVDDKEILVEPECERTLKGWIPRRLGGGFGGKKESGQLRFGGNNRPFRKPILLSQNIKESYTDHSSSRYNSRERVPKDNDYTERSSSKERQTHNNKSVDRREFDKSQPGDERNFERIRPRDQRYCESSQSKERRDRERSRSRDRKELERTRSKEQREHERSRSKDRKEHERSRSKERRERRKSRSRDRQERERSRSRDRKCQDKGWSRGRTDRRD